MQLNYQRLNMAAIEPTYATPGAACFDLYTLDEATLHPETNPQAILSTGLAFAIPEHHVMLVFSRSGHGFKHKTRLSNCVGVIDSDYRGEVKVALSADPHATPLHIKPGDRIAQAMIVPIPTVTFNPVPSLDTTERGQGGFGSTGQ